MSVSGRGEASAAPPARVPRAWRHLPTALAAGAALLELSCLGGVCYPDTPSYVAHTLHAEQNIRFNVREPAYPLLLDLLFLLFPAPWRMAALVVLQQAAVATIPWMVLRCGERLAAPRAGFAAALAAALYAPLSFSAQGALSDALFAVGFVATAFLVCRALALGRAVSWLPAGAMAAIAMAQRSSGIALAAGVVVALLLTAPRRHARSLATFLAAFAATIGLVCLKNRLDFGSFHLVQGAGIHLFCRVAVVERELPDTPEARRIEEVARAAGLGTPLFDQAGWRLHGLLQEREKLTREAADELLYAASTQAMLSDPWRAVRLTWGSMSRAVARADAVSQSLGGILRPRDYSRLQGVIAEAWERSPIRLGIARRLLPDYPPRAADDDPRYRWLAAWGRASRIWGGAWILHALLLLGVLGLVHRDAALVFLTGAPFAHLTATAIGDRPWTGHFDAVAPLFLLALAVVTGRLLADSRARAA